MTHAGFNGAERLSLAQAWHIAEAALADARDGNTAGLFVPGTLLALARIEAEHVGGAGSVYAQLNRRTAEEVQRAVWRLRGAEKKAPSPPGPPATRKASELMRLDFAPIRWLVPGLLPEGLMLLAARPKIGKSWFALDLGIAAATSGRFLGRPVEGGRVLHLALEDNDRRMHARLAKLGATDPDLLERFEYATAWPRGVEGAAAIHEWIDRHDDARLVTVDVFTKLREANAGRDSLYSTDYAEVALFKPPPERPVTIVLVLHTRKAESDDPLDTVSGTLGIGGAADGALILKRARGEAEAELHLVGRDLEDEGQFAVRFDRESCRWEWVGEAWKVRISQERREILDMLAKAPARPGAVAKALDKSRPAIAFLLSKMLAEGQVHRGLDGLYRPAASEKKA